MGLNIVAATSLAMFKARLNDFDLARFTVVFKLGFIVLSYLYVFFSFFSFGVHVRGSCSPLCPCSSLFITHFVNVFLYLLV